MQTGAVKWYRPQRGFGFLAGDDGVEAFVGKEGILEKGKVLAEGQRVRYGLARDARDSGRWLAFHAKVISQA